MGFFDFLKPKGEETISFSDIEAKEVVHGKILETHKFLDELEKAGLMNNNIPLQAKQMMEGHRKTYIQRLKKFLDEIEMPDDYSQIGFFTASFSENLTKLSEDTHKNHLVLKEFMEAELIRVIKSVKGIEDELTRLQADIDKQGIELIKDAKVRLKHYQDDLKKKAMLEEEKLRQNNEVEALKERKQKLQARIDELHTTDEYNEFKELLDNKKKYEDSLKAVETELKTIFAHLNRPLRKYKHSSLQERLIDNYLLDPVGALEEDDSFSMLEVLGKMKQEVNNLELKESQLEKTVEMINKLSREFFLSKKIELDQLKELNKETATKINTSVVALNIAESDTLLRGANDRLEDAEKSLDELAKALDGINLDYLKQKVREKVKEISPRIIIKE
jgi:hypothetical protein